MQFVFLAALGALLFNFHGISLHLTPWSQAIVNAIVKYTYDRTGQDKTLVVLFREENLATLRESFPISYARHAEVLEALAVYEPAAVFVDFAFIDKRPGQDVAPLSEAICALQASGIAVYLAASPLAGKAGGDGLRDGLDRSCFTPVDVQMDAETGVSGVLTYRACKSTATSCEPSNLYWTPAFAMRGPPGGPRARPDAQQMEIIWGNRVSKLNESWMDCTSDGTLVHLRQMLKENPLASKRKCPHTNTISVRAPARALRPEAEGRGRQGQHRVLRGQLRDGGRPGHLAGLRRSARRLPARDGLRQPAHVRPRLQARRAARALALPRGQRPAPPLHDRAAAPGGQAARLRAPASSAGSAR